MSSSTRRAYHHGNLREALLDAAEQSIEASGPRGLSIRGLARAVGVSHAAPNSHFPDRQALLDALARRGFERLGDLLEQACLSADVVQSSLETRFRGTMAAFVKFATDHPELLDLMFVRKRANHDPSSQLEAAANAALNPISRLIDEATGAGILAPGDRGRQWYLLAALTRGIAALVLSGDIQPEAIETLLTDATATFLRGNAPEP